MDILELIFGGNILLDDLRRSRGRTETVLALRRTSLTKLPFITQVMELTQEDIQLDIRGYIIADSINLLRTF